MVVSLNHKRVHLARSKFELEIDRRCRITTPLGTKVESTHKNKIKVPTLLGLLSNRLLSKFELATVADDDRNLRAVFLVCRHFHDLRNDIFVSADHPTEHHMFAWRMDGGSIK